MTGMGRALAELQALFPDGQPVSQHNAAQMPAGKGAYALLIELAKPVAFERAALGSATLSGPLVYAGSANGPGGLRARLGRHLRGQKPVRWHVDELTNAAQSLSAIAIEGGNECAIVARLLKTGRYAAAMRGFGSSDCQRCEAHLLKRVAD